MSKDYDLIPGTYEELYKHYVQPDASGSSIVRTLIRRLMPHVTTEEMETLSQDIYLRFQQHNMLERYDPAKSNFGGAIYFVARSVCVNHMERKTRDPIARAAVLVEEQDTEETQQRGVYGLATFEKVDEVSTERRFASEEVVAKLEAWAAGLALSARNVRDRKVGELLKLLYEQNTPLECAEKLGVSQTTIMNWTRFIAEEAKKWV